MSEFPSELLAQPQPLIGFYGLDLNIASHKAIFDSFNNRVDRPTIQYKAIPFNYECPTKKPKRQSFEWYNPKHILKKNWMLKYLHVLPSLIVVCVELEWKDPQWSEKQLNCSTMVQQLKTKFQDRFTKVALVLLQKTSTFLATDDLIATERAAALANICEINSKQLFVLPVNDQHLLGYTIRLESAFLELSQSFYIQQLKNYRSHQTNSSHQTLKVRHQFKMGFICELRLDFPTALKYYTQAYANLEDIRVVDTNCLEIKTVAGFINYKMCKLMFKLNLPRDSITQFKAHVEKYKARTGFKELLFEHYGWTSLQFQYFADLFSDAVKNGLAALQTQHPGIYYLKAAEFLYKRRETFNQTSGLPTTPLEDLPLTSQAFSALYSDYFGVRNIANKNVESGSDQQIIILVQEMESKFNYSAAIINLLGQAMSQFKVYRCGRERKKCAVMMADEYFKGGEYTKALTLYSLMLSDYRQEKWFTIFTDILLKTVQSSILAASVNDFVAASVESLSPSIKIGKVERQNILENLWKVFNNAPPTYHNQIAPEIKQSWEEVLANHRSPITIELDDIPNLIECKSTFLKNQVKLNEAVVINLFIRSNSEVPIKVRSVATCLLTSSGSNHRYSAKKGFEYKFDNSTKLEQLSNEFMAEDFLLETGKCYKFELEVNPRQFVENVEVGITGVEIAMGTDKNFAVLTLRKSLNLVKYFQRYDIHTDYLENINVVKSCYVIPTFQLSSQSVHTQPMLINEYYKISTSLTNNHEAEIKNVEIIISLPSNLLNKVFLTADEPSAKSKLSSKIKIDVGTMKANGNASICYFITSMIEGNIELKQSLCYQNEDRTVVDDLSTFSQVSSPTDAKNVEKCFADKDDQHEIVVEYLNNVVRKKRDQILIIPCVAEFHFESKFYTLNRMPATSCYKDEHIIMRCTLKMTSPFNLEIVDSFFISDVNVDELSNENEKFVKRNHQRGSQIENLLILRPNCSSNEWVTRDTFNKPVNDDASKLFDAKVIDVKRKENSSKEIAKENEDDPFVLKSKDQKLSYANCSEVCKTIVNSALDVTEVTDSGKAKKGFINAKLNLLDEKSVDPTRKFGMFCIKWKKIDSDTINESKFVIKGIDVKEPLLNIYCTIEERVFVREFFTYSVTLKNPHSEILNMVAWFNINSTDGFMFAGHRQVNVTLLSYSQAELTFNLYPLKSNFQRLPELKLELVNNQDDNALKENLIETSQKPEASQRQAELNDLVKRWLPKSVFVHPPSRKLA